MTKKTYITDQVAGFDFVLDDKKQGRGSSLKTSIMLKTTYDDRFQFLYGSIHPTFLSILLKSAILRFEHLKKIIVLTTLSIG